MKFIFPALAVFGMMTANAGVDRKIPPIDPKVAVFYHLHRQNIYFKQKQYRLFIAEPKTPVHNNAILYLLDGNGHFPLALNSVRTDRTLPVIVGIGYPVETAYAPERRTRDYTFAPEDGKIFKHGGGAEDFLKFIHTSVKPMMEARYSLNKDKQFLFGHSLGGLFGLYVLFHQPDLFQHYVIASPSIWWKNGGIIPQRLPWIKSTPRSILITLGEYEEYPEKDPEITPQRLEKIRQRQRIMPTRYFAGKLIEQNQPVKFYLIPRANHGQSILPALQQTLQAVQK
ncbi:alpha/beta hydrolase-fold protein [Bisgaard Taxon 10/6]|uniref:Alpha/beta hydrolase-fold protein n=1 Tax=Exercitatus varius TaxID=67857 RepID=A0ABT6ER31_9PAST|nr:alpha/beta hydrolase-fold protein [Exercitatus varius]MDG2938799.1 alpha/beta hydrolase-fold protein [Exercitatus varius]MDG2945999.1 alpha/beta hydrolase-fold protein [Exercitatus varius]